MAPSESAMTPVSKALNLLDLRRRLHEDGWTPLKAGMPKWELRHFVERLYRRHNAKILSLLEKWKEDWMKGDSEDTAPGAERPGGLVAKKVNWELEGTGIFVYAAHPSQADDVEDDWEYSGPRWYVTCSEGAMKHYQKRGVAPLPPQEMQEVLWPNGADRRRPWLTECGWTIVPQNSKNQVMHADICSYDTKTLRKPGCGRYHHFAWKLSPEERCTTNVVTGAFTEGSATWDDYEKWTSVKANTVIFDSEMLHRGGPTGPNGWTCTLTLQVCSGAGWETLQDIVSKSLMWYTQPLGWEEGDAVDALVEGSWRPAIVKRRTDEGKYMVQLEACGRIAGGGLTDSELRYRCGPLVAGAAHAFSEGSLVDAFFEKEWCEAKVVRANADGTYRVVWRNDRSFTDALPADAVRASSSGKATMVKSDSASCSGASSSTRADDSEVDGRRKSKPLRKGRKRKAASGAGDESAVSRALSLNIPVPAVLRSRVLEQGWVELPDGLPEAWRHWPVLEFAEAYYDRFSNIIIRELDLLRAFWQPVTGSSQRYGAFAAAKVSERLKPYGVAVYSPGASQDECAPFDCTGPRWYVSITSAAIEHFGSAPAPPGGLYDVFCGHPADEGQEFRARGLGWTLAPPASDPQSLHADIWGTGTHERTDRTRWPHLLWKRRRGDLCTTQIVPGAFTHGAWDDTHFDNIRQVRAPAIVVDSEALHRGARTPPAPASAPPIAAGCDSGWVSTLSLEVCTPSGWAAWEGYETGGTTKDPNSPLDWRMLVIRHPGDNGDDGGLPNGAQAKRQKLRPTLDVRPADLPEAPWAVPAGHAPLRKEQREWEFS